MDDGVQGYMDDGHDDWTGEREEDAESDGDGDDRVRYGRPSKKEKRPKPKPPTVAPSISAYRPKVSSEQEDDFMSSLLGNMDHLPQPIVKAQKRKPPIRYGFDAESSQDEASVPPLSSSPPDIVSPRKKVRVASLDPEIEGMSRLDVQSADESSSFDVDMDEFMDLAGEDLAEPVKLEVEVKEKKPFLSAEFVYESLKAQADDTLGPLSEPTSSSLKPSNISALEPDGSFRFFWLDYLEHDGKLYFVGKLKDKHSGVWASCCVTVAGLQRNLFVLPREKRVEQGDDGELYETDIIPENGDVFADFDRVRASFGIKKWKAKFVKRKYAFGEKDVPRQEREWLKVVYGFDGLWLQSRYSFETYINDRLQSPRYLPIVKAQIFLESLERTHQHSNYSC